MPIIDAHIHLFENPYADVFNNRHIKTGAAGELALYEEYRGHFNIESAFVIAYQYPRNPHNNRFILRQARLRPWMLPFGFIAAEPRTLFREANELLGRGFFGLSIYLKPDDASDWLAATSVKPFWDLVERDGVPISFNLGGCHLPALRRVLDQHPASVILLSHMARPVLQRGKLARCYRVVSQLKKYPNVLIKLSGFYAFSNPGWRYPQDDLFAVLDFLGEHFTARRLLFASDFSPVLEWNTMRQTIELLRSAYAKFSAPALVSVYHRNASRLIEARRLTTQHAYA